MKVIVFFSYRTMNITYYYICQ